MLRPRQPIAPILGGALDSESITVSADDGNRFSGFLARAATPTGAAILVLPDIRGLHPYYEELALRFAESGLTALAIDWFGRTAGLGPRGEGFEHASHVERVTWAGLSADIRAGASRLREESAGPTFAIGFCFGGRNAFLAGTLGLALAGAIGFYGVPVGAGRSDIPAPADVARDMGSPVLGIFGGADQAIPQAAVDAFDRALTDASVEHRLVVYPGAPHSFFDRKAEQFADASSAAWNEVQAFIRDRSAG